uniref:Protein kinase domain-containing protein n=1 Tax=Leersia perrieri TaxID=77586 RepID=A0A0D9XVH4_9ORYZ
MTVSRARHSVCCQVPSIPPNLSIVQLHWGGSNSVTPQTSLGDTACNYAFVAEKGWYVPTVCAVVALLVLAWFIHREHKRRRQKGYFDSNGGRLLEKMGVTIFNEKKIEEITNKKSTKIGNGAYGEVYKGTYDNQDVAMKYSIAKGATCGKEEFVNEITIQMQVSHNNVVRLIGCWMETKVPMLVFEFIPNGSLEGVLHGKDRRHHLSLQQRLDIAAGSAEALSCMHSRGHRQIVHGDIKPGIFFLVSDFGSSELTLKNKHAKNWTISADMNYIDPIYKDR